MSTLYHSEFNLGCCRCKHGQVLTETDTCAQVRAQRGRIDLGLLLPPVDGAEIITDPVWSEEWLAALPKAHPLVRRTKLHATDFDGQNVIIGEDASSID
jgi:DNA-binding transcriptional LysR family regulator